MAACKGTTKAGKPCSANAVKNTRDGALDPTFCMGHQPRERKKAVGFGGSQEGSGRPRRPREIELIQEVAEEFKDDLRKVFSEGLSATRAVVVGNGPESYVDYVPDHPHRLKVAIEVNDRLHGRAKQSTEISGAIKTEGIDTAPITRPEHVASVASLLTAAKANVN